MFPNQTLQEFSGVVQPKRTSGISSSTKFRIRLHLTGMCHRGSGKSSQIRIHRRIWEQVEGTTLPPLVPQCEIFIVPVVFTRLQKVERGILHSISLALRVTDCHCFEQVCKTGTYCWHLHEAFIIGRVDRPEVT